MVEVGAERSQQMNKETALKRLRAKLFEIKINKEMSKVHAERRLQVSDAFGET